MLALPALIGGWALLNALSMSILVQEPPPWIFLSILAVGFLGILYPRTRGRAASHILALCVSSGALLIVTWVTSFAATRWPIADDVTWIWRCLAAAFAGFIWMFSGLAANRRWPESVLILSGLGSLLSWGILIDGQMIGVPMTGLSLFLCTLVGGWMGSPPPAAGQGKRAKGVGILAICLATVSVTYTAVLLPPGELRSITIDAYHWEQAYWVQRDVDGESTHYALRLGDPGDEPITVLGAFDSYRGRSQLTPVRDSQTIDEIYQLLADADNERLEYAVKSGKAPPFAPWFWKFRSPPRRGSIWVESPVD